MNLQASNPGTSAPAMIQGQAPKKKPSIWDTVLGVGKLAASAFFPEAAPWIAGLSMVNSLANGDAEGAFASGMEAFNKKKPEGDPGLQAPTDQSPKPQQLLAQTPPQGTTPTDRQMQQTPQAQQQAYQPQQMMQLEHPVQQELMAYLQQLFYPQQDQNPFQMPRQRIPWQQGEA